MEPGSAEPCELLPWDSNFFGLTVARARADVLTAESAAVIEGWCRAHRVDCLYFLARADDPLTVTLAEQHGYHLADVRLTLEHAISNLQSEISNSESKIFAVRPARPDDLPALRAIARASHTDTRFFFDPRFPRDLCHRLYETWIESSLNGFAQAVLLAAIPSPEGIAGYVSCHLPANSDTASIGLIAVAPAHQGQGVGKALITAALDWFASHGARRVTVVTQGRNVAAQRLYARCGFIPSRLELYYHRWFTP